MEPTRAARAQTPGRLVLALLLLSLGVFVAACGGTGSANNKPSSQTSDVQRLKYEQCMQQHGVTVVNNGNQHGLQGSEQQVQAAQQACKQYAPNGGVAPRQPSTQQMDQMTKFVQCLNQHGVPMQQQRQGGPMYLPPGFDQSKVQQAMQACQQYAPATGGS
jgi:hypothetical protein